MIVSIHQPHFLPWLGYFNKALRSDVFVWLHSVQYRKNNFQNRTSIKNVNEQPLWLTLPVHAKLETSIDEVTIATPEWREKIFKTVEQCYRKTPYFTTCWPAIRSSIEEAQDTLNDVNWKTFRVVLALMGVDTLRVERMANLAVTSSDPTIRLVEACKLVGATHYISGRGGHKYLRVEEFQKEGIEVVWQEFDPNRVVYKQAGKVFVPGLSVIDCLFNTGPEETRSLALNAWLPTLELK